MQSVLFFASDISKQFEQSKAAAEGLSEVQVISAYAIAKRIGKQVEIKPGEDRDLIGGVVIRVGDAVIDASIKGR